MKVLEKFENKKGNKLIFRQTSSDIPSLGSSVLIEKQNKNSSSSKNKNYAEIGKIIDIFGPVKDPWVVVNLFNDKELEFENATFYWRKREHFKKKFSKDDKKSSKTGRKFSKEGKKYSRDDRYKGKRKFKKND